MIRLAIRTLRHRASGFVAAFLAIFLGAAIVMACGGLMETGIRTAVPPQQLAGADVVVAGEQQYQVPGLNYTVVLPERVRIEADLVATIAGLPGVQDASAHIFDDPAPEGTVDAIAVVAEAGTGVDELAERIGAELNTGAIGTATTLTGDERGLAELPQARLSADGLISLAAVFGAMALMVAVFGVASMLALAVQQRHREMALLRAIGSTPRQVRQLVVGETVILAAIATGMAILPGRWLGQVIFASMVDAGMVPGGVVFRLGWVPMVIAIGSAILAAAGGALVAGRRAARTRPTQALADAGLPERRPIGAWRVILGLLLLAGGAALAMVTTTVLSGELASATGMPAVIVWAIALAVLSPVLTRPLAALLRPPVRALTGQAGRLAMLNVRAGIDRTAAVVSPVIVLTGIAIGMLSMQATEESAIEQEYAESLIADAVVTADGVDAQLVADLAAAPGVVGAYPTVQSIGFVEAPYDPALREEGVGWTLQGITPNALGTLVPATVTDGSADDLRGPTVAMGVNQAAELEVGVGDTITVRAGDNTTVALEVVALLAAEGDPDTLLLPADVLAARTTEGRITEVMVLGDGSIDDEELVVGLEEVAASSGGVTVADREAQLAEYDDAQGAQALATYTIVVVVATYSMLSMVNALASSTTSRRRELGLQRLTGFTRGQVLRMLAIEGVVVAAIGALLGTLAAIAAIVPFGLGRAGTLYPSGSPLIVLAVVSATVLLALLATVLPGWQATRRQPIEAAAPG